MKAENTILVSLATGVASVCLLLTCLNMYMLNNMRTTLKSLDGHLSKSPDDIFQNSALIADSDPAIQEKDDLITALYRHIDHQNTQIAQYEIKLQHLADLHEHRNHLLQEQEAIRQHHLNAQRALESQKRKLAKKLTKFQLEKQAHQHKKEVEEYERQLQQTFEQLQELQRRQEQQHLQQLQPFDDVDFPSDLPVDPEGVVFMVQHENEFPFSPLELFLSQIFGGPFGAPYEEDQPLGPAVTLNLDDIRDADDTHLDHPDFASEPTPVEDADVLADTDSDHVVVNRVLPTEMPSTTPVPVLPTPAA